MTLREIFARKKRSLGLNLFFEMENLQMDEYLQ